MYNTLEAVIPEEEIKKFYSSMQNKDKLYRWILHDLRNAAVAIHSIATLINEKKKESKLDEILKYNCLIINASESLLFILEDFESFLRSLTTNKEEHFHNFSIEKLVTSLLGVTAPNASKKNISIEFDIFENSIVFANEWLTSTILRNLILNAIKFTERNGKVIISAEIVKDYLEISVLDTGVGINSTDLDKIFNPDLKFSKLGTEKEKGTGLGLILCKEFVEMQNGRIWVKSKFGFGSKFSFILPVGK
jgi:two-component system sensor histidine kinase/response regulator